MAIGDKKLLDDGDLDIELLADDANADDPELETEEEEGVVPEPEQEAASEPQESRANRRIRAAVAEAQKARADAEAASAALRRLEEQNSATVQQQAAQRAQQEEEERLMLLDPEEQMKYRLNKVEERYQNQLRAMEARLMDNQDRVSFYAEMGNKPVAKPYLEKVERTKAELKARGVSADRRVILAHMIGEEFLNNGEKALSSQARQAAAAVNRQKVNPRNVGSDATSSRRSAAETSAQRDARLASVEF